MDRLTNILTRIRTIREADLPILESLAKADQHSVVFPTHVVEKGQQMIGYLSIANVPTVLLWLDTTRAVVRDSFAVMNFVENTISDRGGHSILLPCNEKSPFRPFIEQIGYVDLKSGSFLKLL